MKEPKDIDIEILEPALTGLKSHKLFRLRLAIGAQAIRLGLCRALVVLAPDDAPNCFVLFFDKHFGSNTSYHLDVKKFKLVRLCELNLPEPTRQPDDPIEIPCANGKSCNC